MLACMIVVDIERTVFESLMQCTCCFAALTSYMYASVQTNSSKRTERSTVNYTLTTETVHAKLSVYCVGQRIDGPSNGAAPLPWDVHCNPTQMFHSEVRHVEVPHTAIVTVRTRYITPSSTLSPTHYQLTAITSTY